MRSRFIATILFVLLTMLLMPLLSAMIAWYSCT